MDTSTTEIYTLSLHDALPIFETQAGATAISNSKGLFAYAKQTALALTTTVRTEDGTGSGWAGATSHDLTKLRTEEHTSELQSQSNPVCRLQLVKKNHKNLYHH